MEKIIKTYYQSPVGILEISQCDDHISALRILSQIPDNVGMHVTSPLLEKAVRQLDEYFTCKRTHFDLPVKQEGTTFQKRAWDFLRTIPYGKTVSYKQEAEAIGSPRGSRAVGSANGKNNIPIIIPCHRVINEGGGLGGFAYEIEIKQYLLDMERLNINSKP